MIHAAYSCIAHPGHRGPAPNVCGVLSAQKRTGGDSGWWSGGNLDQASEKDSWREEYIGWKGVFHISIVEALTRGLDW